MVSRSSCKYSTHLASGFVLCTDDSSHDSLINQLLKHASLLLDNSVQCSPKLEIAYACLRLVTVVGRKQSELCWISPWQTDLTMQNKVSCRRLFELPNTTQLQISLLIVLPEHRSQNADFMHWAQQRLLSSQASNRSKRGLECVPGTASAPALQWPEHPLPCWDCCHPSFYGVGQCQCPGAHPSCPPHSPAPATHAWHVLHIGLINSYVKAKGFPKSFSRQTRDL